MFSYEILRKERLQKYIDLDERQYILTSEDFDRYLTNREFDIEYFHISKIQERRKILEKKNKELALSEEEFFIEDEKRKEEQVNTQNEYNKNLSVEDEFIDYDITYQSDSSDENVDELLIDYP